MPYVEITVKAKQLRAELAQKFPGTKFSVRSNSYSLGSSIDVRYRDGPALDKVEAITRKYEDIDYDQTTGEVLGGGNQYVHAQREISPEYQARVEEETKQIQNVPYPHFYKEEAYRRLRVMDLPNPAPETPKYYVRYPDEGLKMKLVVGPFSKEQAMKEAKELQGKVIWRKGDFTYRKTAKTSRRRRDLGSRLLSGY